MDSKLILYTSNSGNVSVQVQYEDGTFWLTQRRMSELFNVDVRTVNDHLRNIFLSGELSEEGTGHYSVTYQAQPNYRQTEYFQNLRGFGSLPRKSPIATWETKSLHVVEK